jgi:lipoprotein-anchoring transpeptidase ErfK/SrfK
MTPPSSSPSTQAPRLNPFASGSSARSARGLFIAIAVLGFGGAAAGWLLTHKNDTPTSGVTPEQGAVVDPLAAQANAAGGESVITVVTPTPTPALGAPSPVATGTTETASTLPSAALRVQQATSMILADPVRARLELTRLLDGNQLSPMERVAAYQAINTLAEQLFFSQKIVPGDTVSQSYLVKRGDSLARIAKRESLNVEWGFIQRINALPNERALRPDMRLKLHYGPFDAEVVKSDFRLNIYSGQGNDRIMVASLPCGLGEGDSTPTGTFKVRAGSKLQDPEWRNPRTGEFFAKNDPKNPIGERWIGLQGATPESARFTGYGIHGTVDPTSIGKQASMGCVRLGDAEVQVAYELLCDGSTIVIR